jgi:hypothetical protein
MGYKTYKKRQVSSTHQAISAIAARPTYYQDRRMILNEQVSGVHLVTYSKPQAWHTRQHGIHSSSSTVVQSGLGALKGSLLF